MFACEYIFWPRRGVSRPDFIDELWSLAGELRRGGQTVNEDDVILKRSSIRYLCICPERDSLDPRHHTLYAEKAYNTLVRLSARKPDLKARGETVESPSGCTCQKWPFLILFTHFLDTSSPILCGGCRNPVPLYRFPRLKDGNYSDYLTWQESYRHCDSLFIMSGVGERFGYRQMAVLNSELTELGRKLCAGLEQQTGIRVYYYLHRYYGTSAKSESTRRCPGCGNKWSAHDSSVFELRCDGCRLLSTAAQDFSSV